MPSLFRCVYCQDIKWQPVTWYDAVTFSELIRAKGLDEAYRQVLTRKKKAKNVVQAMQMLLAGKEIQDEELKINNLPNRTWIPFG